MARYNKQQYLLHSHTQAHIEKTVSRFRKRAEGEWVFMIAGLAIAMVMAWFWGTIGIKTGRSGLFFQWLGFIAGGIIAVALAVFFVSGKKLARFKRILRYLRKHPAEYAIKKRLAGVLLVAQASPDQALPHTFHGCKRCELTKDCRRALQALYELRIRSVELASPSITTVTDSYIDAFDHARQLNAELIAAHVNNWPHKLRGAHAGMRALTSDIDVAVDTLTATIDDDAEPAQEVSTRAAI